MVCVIGVGYVCDAYWCYYGSGGRCVDVDVDLGSLVVCC